MNGKKRYRTINHSQSKLNLMLKYIKGINEKNKAVEIYYKIFGEGWGEKMNSPSEFIKQSWTKVLHSELTRNDNGAIFEYLVAVCLYSKKILPFYLQAKISFVPNATYDIVLYNSEGYPITLSIKTSLRERYKQADLEGLALKNVHRRAKNYLITLSAKEYPGVKKKIQEGDVAGLDNIILADSKEFDELIDGLSRMSFVKSEAIKVIQGKVVE